MDEETKPKRKAKDNPWYLLATFHGEPRHFRDEVAVKNRVTWNRWMAPWISDDLRAVLLEKGYTLEELTPFPDDKLPTIDGISADAKIDFSDTEFEALFANNFVFPDSISFSGATFSGDADFRSATFSSNAYFRSTAFSGDADFRSTAFSGNVDFDGATFSGNAVFKPPCSAR
jgi:hypothetical protein